MKREEEIYKETVALCSVHQAIASPEWAERKRKREKWNKRQREQCGMEACQEEKKRAGSSYRHTVFVGSLTALYVARPHILYIPVQYFSNHVVNLY